MAPTKTLLAPLAAAGFAYYHAQIPTSQLYGKTICREPEAGKRIAITFDDGPNPAYTETMMRTLERHNAHGTFFLIGRWAEREPGLIRELHEAGHAIGDHTFTHPTLALKSGSEVQEELRRCRGAVEASGVTFSEVDGASIMRPPWGRRRPGTLRAIREAGFVPVLWSITGFDWRKRETAHSIARHCRKTGEGDIILLHDGTHLEPAGDRSKSVGAAEEIMSRLVADGYEFVTVPELVKQARAA